MGPKLQASFQIGTIRIDALSDGAPERSLAIFFGDIEPDVWAAALGISDPNQLLPFNFGAFLVRDGQDTVLIDSGRGAPAKAMNMAGGGGLLQRLADIAVNPSEIDTVIHTHLHHDHCGWNVADDASGNVTFPNARFYVSRRELEYWTGPETNGNEMAEYVRSRIGPVVNAGRIVTFEGEHKLSESITIMPTPGHTPGHSSVVVTSGDERLIVLGDAAHHPIHLEHHDWVPSVDVDPALSRRSRGELCALAADWGAVVTGGHFPILTRGHVRRRNDGYVWEPLA